MKLKRNTKSIYVIENMDNGRVKIGYSDNPDKRIKSLMMQGGCLMAVRYASHQIKDFSEIESNLHSMFISERYVGEWFNISVKEAINAVKRMVKNRHDCLIVQKFEEGVPVKEIGRLNGVSRTAIVNYLHSKGYSPKDRLGEEIKRVKYKPARPHKEESSIEMSSLEKMVVANNKKIAKMKSKKH